MAVSTVESMKDNILEHRATPSCPWSDVSFYGETLVVHDFLTTRLSTLMSTLRRQVTAPYAKAAGLSIAEWRILSLVAHARVLPFGTLVAQSTSDKALVSRVVRQLEKRGLIRTQPGTDKSKKKFDCFITAQGEAIEAETLKAARQAQAMVLRLLTQAEREALFSIISKLQVGLDTGTDLSGLSEEI